MDTKDLKATGIVETIDRDLTVKTAWTHQCSVDVGTVGRRHDDNAGVALEAIHFGEQLVQRLLTLVVYLRGQLRADGPASISSINTMQGAFSWPARTGPTGGLPTPTNISTNSEPEMEKKGTPASPATALARGSYRSGGPTKNAQNLGSNRRETIGVLEEVDNLSQLNLAPAMPATSEK